MRFLRRRQPDDLPSSIGDPDARLVAWAQQDPQAFTALYDRYFSGVFGYCLHHLGDAALAEDATSQTFLKALAALPRYRETGRFRPWLFTIAHNAVLDTVHRRPELTLDAAIGVLDPTASPEEQAIVTLDAAWLDAAIAQLPPDDREVLELRRAGLSGQEIAVVLGIGHEAAKKRQLRAMARLRADYTATIDSQEACRGA